MTFGANVQTGSTQGDHEERLLAILDRQEPLQALLDLIDALHPQQSSIALQETAIALDTSVFIRLSANKKIADIIDYLNTSHTAPLILPGQSIQEFWNNQHQVIDSVAGAVKKTFDQLKSHVARIDTNFDDYSSRFEELLTEFRNDFGYAFDDNISRRTQKFLDLLKDKALVPYATRLKFSEIALHRKQTKTPPGFRDDRDGDFFVWVDFMLGLKQAKGAGKEFKRAVLVTSDEKIDWTRYGAAHPILCSEIKALVGVPFEIWSIKKFVKQVEAVA